MVVEKNKLTISIVGDSFSSDYGDHSWITMLSKNYAIQNFSQRGISQYRLHDLVCKNLQCLQNSDFVIIFHTNPDRIYVPDHVKFFTRELSSHPFCDMVSSTVLQDPDFKQQAQIYYKYFFDQHQQNVLYNLLLENIKQITNNLKTIHCSGFETGLVKSFAEVFVQYRGNVNHLNETGNRLMYNYIKEQLDEKL